MHTCGIVFIIFFVNEIKPAEPVVEEPKLDADGAENPAYDGSTLELRDRHAAANQSTPIAAATPPPVAETGFMGFIKNGFQLSLSNFTVFKVERANFGRTLLIIVMGIYMLFVFTTGEQEIRIPFGRVAWGWATEFGDYYSYISGISFLGNIIVTGLFINFMKLSDPTLAIVAFITSIVSRTILVRTSTLASTCSRPD